MGVKAVIECWVLRGWLGEDGKATVVRNVMCVCYIYFLLVLVSRGD